MSPISISSISLAYLWYITGISLAYPLHLFRICQAWKIFPSRTLGTKRSGTVYDLRPLFPREHPENCPSQAVGTAPVRAIPVVVAVNFTE